MKRYFARLVLALMGVLIPSAASAQGLDITRGQRGLVIHDILEHQFIVGTERFGVVGGGGSVAAKLLTGLTVGAPVGLVSRDYTFTRTGTTGAAVHPPPYPGRLQFFVADKGDNAVMACTGGTVKGIDPFGTPVSETVTGSIDDTPATAPVLTTNAYSDVISASFTGCTLTSGTLDADQFVLAVSDWVFVGQKIRTPKQIHKICGHDFDADPAINTSECFNGYQINTEKTWSSIFHARSNTIDLKTLFTTDTQLFSGVTLENIHIETYPFPVSF